MNFINNLKIRSKLILGFTVLVIITGLTGYLGIHNLSRISQKESFLFEDNITPMTKLAAATDSFQKIRVNARDMVLAADQGELEQANERINIYKDTMNSFIGYYKTTAQEGREQDTYNNFVKVYGAYINDLNLLHNYATNGGKDKAVALLKGSMHEEATALQSSLLLLVHINKQQAESVNKNNLKDAASSIKIMIIFMSAGLIFSILLAWLISRIISGGISQIYSRIESLKNICIINLKNGSEQLAHGDLNVKIETGTKLLEIKSHDEIGLLASGVNEIITMIQATVVSVENAVFKVRELIEESQKMVDAGLEGNLKKRSDTDQFEGGYRDVITGLNKTLDTIIMPLTEASVVLAKMSKGDLTVKMKGDYKGDYKLLKDSINDTVRSLNKAMSQVTETIEATASAAGQISSSAEQIAAGSQEQSSQTAEVASAVEQMTKTILETSKNANAASEAAKSAGTVAKEGGTSVFDAVEGMNNISSIVDNAARTVTKLGDSSTQIGEIVRVIDDIADQTNLLALNAAIEAARAGEQGRGFAVVADEVRKLAEQTTKATKEIELMIKQIQGETEEAVNSMNRGTEEVKKGKQLADKAGKALDEIISGSVKVVDIIYQVAAASEEQSTAAEQISRNVEGISTVTNESAAGVQQIAQATEDLNRLTLNLQNLVGNFKIGTEETSMSVLENGTLETVEEVM